MQGCECGKQLHHKVENLQHNLFLTPSWALFLLLLNFFLVISLMLYQSFFSIFKASNAFCASFQSTSSSLSRTMNCFWGRIHSFTTLRINASKTAYFPLQSTSGDKEAAIKVVSMVTLLSTGRWLALKFIVLSITILMTCVEFFFSPPPPHFLSKTCTDFSNVAIFLYILVWARWSISNRSF